LGSWQRLPGVTALTLEQLARLADVRTYATRDEAERAARMVP